MLSTYAMVEHMHEMVYRQKYRNQNHSEHVFHTEKWKLHLRNGGKT